jgi:hypothetical protein
VVVECEPIPSHHQDERPTGDRFPES